VRSRGGSIGSQGSNVARSRREPWLRAEPRPTRLHHQRFLVSDFWFTLFGCFALATPTRLMRSERVVAWAWQSAILVAYIVSRGIAKAGSSDVIRAPDRN
jgi:hypothetical protein